MILISVDLPAPFSPTSAWISPARTSNDHVAERRRHGEALGDAAEFEGGTECAGGVRPRGSDPGSCDIVGTKPGSTRRDTGADPPGLTPHQAAKRRCELVRRGFDVRLVVDRERPHQHALGALAARVFLDLEVAHAAGGELLADLTLDGAGRQQVAGVVGEVAEVDEAPQRELRGAAVHGVATPFRPAGRGPTP